MKKLLPLLLLFSYSLNLFAEKYDFESVNIPGVENPVDIALSPNGLQMVIVDWPKREKRSLKLSNRPYLESTWGAAIDVKNINALIGEDTRISGPSYSYDGKRLFFAADFNDSEGGTDIYVTEVIGNTLSTPQNIGEPVNTTQNENYPSLAGNQRELFFTRAEEIDKLDDYETGALWSAKIDGFTNNWNEPFKLNTQINDGGIAYPKVSDDNLTLLYSRVIDDNENWKIFWVKRMSGIHWYLPVKLDTLASKNSEVAPSYCARDGYLYYVLYERKGHPKGELYRYPLDHKFKPDPTIVINGKVEDLVNENPLSANVLLTSPVMGDTLFYARSDSSSGEYWVMVNAEEEFMLHSWSNNYSHSFQLFDKTKTQQNINENINLFPEVTIFLNMYDKEDLWPLDGKVTITEEKGASFNPEFIEDYAGRKQVTLPIGKNYTFNVELEDYFSNNLQLDLSGIVLFDEFVRDIELEPEKRVLELYIVDEETNNPLVASIEIYDERGRLLIPEPVKNVIGLYSILLREGESFDIEVRGPKGFAFKHEEIDLAADRQLKRKAIALSPLKMKVPIQLQNINFEFNSADLLETSFAELGRVIQLLKDNPGIHAEIMAHTDDIGSDQYNNILANKRAKSVVEFLVMNGIQSDRLIPKGYGESSPLVPNTSEENRAINRRVEMKILDEEDEAFYIEKRITE